MKRRAIGGGVYADEAGGFWARPWVLGRRTWRKLKATKDRYAIKEANQTVYNRGAMSFRDLAKHYLDSGCPNRKLEARESEQFLTSEKANIAWLIQFFGNCSCEEITLSVLSKYHKWRTGMCKRGGGDRTVDIELVTLSNVLSFGVADGKITANHIRHGRPKYRRHQDVRHCVESAPRDADDINRIAEELFSDVRSQSLAWMFLFAVFTGCRRSELLRLRVDAALGPDNKPQPGHIHESVLYIRRSKRGINPKRPLTTELAELTDEFFAWHKERFPKAHWYFPGSGGRAAVSKDALNHTLRRVCASLKMRHITPHGLRSYYVTKRRREGATDAMIAEEIGDKDVSLVQKVYGDFIDGAKLTFAPATGLPAWKRWRTIRSPVLVHSSKKTTHFKRKPKTQSVAAQLSPIVKETKGQA